MRKKAYDLDLRIIGPDDELDLNTASGRLVQAFAEASEDQAAAAMQPLVSNALRLAFPGDTPIPVGVVLELTLEVLGPEEVQVRGQLSHEGRILLMKVLAVMSTQGPPIDLGPQAETPFLSRAPRGRQSLH